jgi:hypothetical protein
MKTNILTLLFVSLLCVHFAKCDLKFVFSMFRHGARSPTALDSKNNDAFGENWPNPGELTPAGKRMHFLLGLRNRQVYQKFTTKQKEDGSVYIRSTDYNRTMESVESQMQGFFPPGTGHLIKDKKTRAIAHPFIDDPSGQNWTRENKFLGMRTIIKRVETFPVHLFAKQNPLYAFFYNPFSCKGFNQMLNKNRENIIIKDYFKNLKTQFGPQLMKMAGQNNTDFLDNYWFVFGLMDSFISDVYDGRVIQKAHDAGIDIQAFNQTAFEFSKNDVLYSWNGDKEAFMARWTASVLSLTPRAAPQESLACGPLAL